MKVLIIGGGIGGLTAAVAMRRAGFDVHVYEQMRELREIGAGVVLGANAVRALTGFGLGEKVKSIGLEAISGDRFHWQTGEFIDRTMRADVIITRNGLPSYMCHRAEAHEVVKSGVPEDRVSLNMRCVKIEEANGQVTAHFADGSSATGDVLVGADGAESVVRDYVLEGKPFKTDYKVAWRGLAPGEVGEKLGMEVRQYSMRAQGKFFLYYYVTASHRYVNWVAIMNPKEEWTSSMRFVPGTREAALADYAGWADPVRTLIESTEEVSKWIIYDGDPMEFWSRGHVTLLGDACHPMLPFAGQGAGQAIEDAVILSRCLEATPDRVDYALGRYFRQRYERASAIQARGRRNGARTLNPELGVTIQTLEAPIPDDWVHQYDALNVPLNV